MVMKDDTAGYHREHRGDEAEWEDADPPEDVLPNRQLGATVTVRLAPQDAALLRMIAKREKVAYSELIREAVRRFLRPLPGQWSPAQPNVYHARTMTEADHPEFVLTTAPRGVSGVDTVYRLEKTGSGAA